MLGVPASNVGNRGDKYVDPETTSFVTEILGKVRPTAGHDLDSIQPPIVLDASQACERFIGIGGQEYVFTAGAVNNLESSAYIPSHFTVAATEVGMALAGAINTNEIGTTEGD